MWVWIKNIIRRVIHETQIRFGNIDGGVESLRIIIRNRIGVVGAGGDFEAGVESRAEHCGRNLAHSAAEFGNGFVGFDDEFGKIAG